MSHVSYHFLLLFPHIVFFSQPMQTVGTAPIEPVVSEPTLVSKESDTGLPEEQITPEAIEKKLQNDVVRWYQASSFERGKIPLIPPPDELC